VISIKTFWLINKVPVGLNTNFKRLCYAIGAVLLLLQLNSCKDPVITDRGNTLALQPLNLSHIDTCTVTISTVADRPLISSGVSTGVLGSMNDVFFGKTYAGVYAQLLISANSFSFSGKTLDSAVLIMPFINTASKYGHCDKPIDISVYELSQNMIPGYTYYSNDGFSVYGQPVGQRLDYVSDLTDSVRFIDPLAAQGLGGTQVPYRAQSPMLRVRLSNAFSNKLFSTPDSTLLASLTFIDYVKGLYITTNTSKVGDGLMYLALNNSAINMYYHTAGGTDTSLYQFLISTYGVTVNHFDHYYGGTLVQNALSNPAPGGDKAAYIQGGGGTKIRLRIPYLTNLKSKPGNIGITKAELIMPVLDTLVSDPSYQPPSVIALYRIDDKDSIEPLNANNLSGSGVLTTRQDDNGRAYLCYVFNLTEYVQRVLNGYYSNNNGYYVGFSYTVRGDRTILLNDPAKLSTQCKLKITYTKLIQ
jgi:hypothetical protein